MEAANFITPDIKRPHRLVVMMSDIEWDRLNKVSGELDVNRSRLVRDCISHCLDKVDDQ